MILNHYNSSFKTGFPAIIVAISLAATQAVGYGNAHACWLDVSSGLIWGFIAPAITVILVSKNSLRYESKNTYGTLTASLLFVINGSVVLTRDARDDKYKNAHALVRKPATLTRMLVVVFLMLIVCLFL